MTFFYDLNKRLADIATVPEQLNESAAVKEGSTGDYSAQKARAGKDIGRPGKNFAKIAKGAAERYGSKERGEKVAGAVLAKLRKGVGEAAKPDYIDLDRDGNRTEPMKQAARQAKSKKPMDEVKLADLPVRSVKGRAYGAQPEEFDQEDDMDTPVSDQPKKKGRPKGTGRKLGAKPTGTSKLARQSAIREGDIEIQDQGEYDQEGDMAKDDIHTLVRDARALERILGDNDNLPEWVQAKLTKAKGMISAVSDYMQTERERAGEKAPDMALDEKAVSVAQRRAAGIAHAAQKGDIPKTKLRGASKEMAKMPAGELKKFAKTKEKGLPKKKEEVEETTTSGSVATAPAEAPKKSRGGMQFGKGIYDSMNRELEAMIAESMSVNISSSTEGSPSVSVSATDEDAAQLAQILKAAGIGTEIGGHGDACPACGSSPCGCAEQVDENQPDWPTNTEQSDDALQYSGGLNKPKTTVAGDGQTTVPVTAVQVQEQGVAEGEDTCMECGMYESRCKCDEGVTEGQQDGIPFRGKMVDRYSIEIDGVDSSDYPDFADAYIERAQYTDGTELTSDELDDFGDEHGDIVSELAYEYMTGAADFAHDQARDNAGMDRMLELAGVREAAKPDFLDLDRDGNKTEPMKKAADEKDDKKVEESVLNMNRLWQAYKA